MRTPAAVLGVLLGAALAFAADGNGVGTAHVITFDFGNGTPKMTVLALGEGAAEAIYDGMTGVPTNSYQNTCEGKKVRVEKRTGVTFSCERWPDTCWGKPSFKCESSVDFVTGKAVAR